MTADRTFRVEPYRPESDQTAYTFGTLTDALRYGQWLYDRGHKYAVVDSLGSLIAFSAGIPDGEIEAISRRARAQQ